MMELRVTSSLLLRDAEQRIISGVVVPYGSETRVAGYRETFAAGAFRDADAATVPLLVSHRHADLPIGRTLSFEEGTVGLSGEWKLSETRDADEVLNLARDGVPLGLSIGFSPIEDRWSKDRRRVTRLRARLGEVSVVGVPQYPESQVAAVRSATPRLDAARLLGR
jgi:Escherichia/Staphylococcus phage prohead protease